MLALKVQQEISSRDVVAKGLKKGCGANGGQTARILWLSLLDRNHEMIL
jgi:hypothetical protein